MVNLFFQYIAVMSTGKYLPYSSTTSDGSYKTTALTTDQSLFYSAGSLIGLDKTETRPFSPTLVEVCNFDVSKM